MAKVALSVIVIITGDDGTASRCIHAVSSQQGAPPMEIVVPLYAERDGSARLRREWPAVRFIDVPDPAPPPGPIWEHLKVDRLRAVGLKAVRGDIVAMLQDNALPDKGWCAGLWKEHREKTHQAIGGAVRYEGSNLLHRAIYYCDFARYQPPFPETCAGYASVLNVSYKRAALAGCQESWNAFFDESVIHRRILDSGGTLYLTPRLVVNFDPGPVSIVLALHRKIASGRAFAGRRAQETGLVRRIFLTALSPGLPPLLLLRMFLLLRRRARPMAPFFAALPMIFACLIFWSIGEMVGYVSAQPFPGSREDI